MNSDKKNITRKDFIKLSATLSMGGLITSSGKINKFSNQDNKYKKYKDIELILDTSKVGNQFDGIGGVSAGASSRLLIDYPEPERSQILDFLFMPNFGAEFQHLKVELGGGINSTDGTEPSHARTREEMIMPQREYFERGYEWWLMKEAKKRNPNIKLGALAWGAPGWVGNGNFFSHDCAEYFSSYLLGLKRYHNISLDYIGTWNEHPFTEIEGNWIILLRKILNKNGLSNVKIVANDAHSGPNIWKIAEAMNKDKILFNSVDVLGVHYPNIPTSKNALALQKRGKKLWASEDNYRGGVNSNLNFIDRKLTQTEYWSPVTSYYDCLVAPKSGTITANAPWSGAYEILPRLWQVAHTTQFVKPGWLYLKDANMKLPHGGSIVSLTSQDRKEISIIIETMRANREQTLIIKPNTDISHFELHVWKSNQLDFFIKQESIKSKDGVFKIDIEPNCNYTLTTTTGQRKGTYPSPNPRSFPLPYKDSFNSYPINKSPKYLSDFYGVFEISKDIDGEKYLKQKLNKKGIQWLSRIPEAKQESAYTVIGDHHWNDINVSVDALFGKSSMPVSAQYIMVIARFYPRNFDCFKQPYPVGYSFRLYANGQWSLYSADQKLTEGNISRSDIINNWQNIRMKCVADNIQAYVNNEKVTSIRDKELREGLVGIGSYLGPVYFKNLRISKPMNR